MKAILILLLSLPVDPSPILPHKVPHCVFDNLKSIAWEQELSGPNCKWMSDFRCEFRWTYLHLRDCQGLPLISECTRFPPSELCYQYAWYSKKGLNYFEAVARERIHWQGRLVPYIEAAKFTNEFWQLAAQCNSEHCWSYRRQKLMEIKTLMGEEAWNWGYLPPLPWLE